MLNYHSYCAERRKNMTLHSDPLVSYRAMIATATQEVCIFTGRGDLEYQTDFLDAAKVFLAVSSHTMRLACQCGHAIDTCPIIIELQQAAHNGGSRLIVHDANRFDGIDYFMVADGKGFRLERPGNVLAKVNYGDTARAGRLLSFFDQIAAETNVIVEV